MVVPICLCRHGRQVERLSGQAREAIEDGRNEVYFSAASAWEIAIKYVLGKLKLPPEPARYIPERLRSSGMTPLPIEFQHAMGVGRLPHHHNVPFDRLLIVQARQMKLTLVTSDPRFSLYGASILPAG